ncbi:MAG: formylmethanofuran dehydrogenase subunit C [Hyphomicrobiaceae bacterium]|nr:formylmethanofuran dehydrogenase subunit C [Hyphomicrobiaceae bacterium]
MSQAGTSRLTLSLRAEPAERCDLSALTPGRIAGMARADIERMAIGTTNATLRLADVFTVSGEAGGEIVIAGGSTRLDFVGAGLDGGSLTVEGDVGAYAAAGMTGGTLTVRGDTGPWLGAGMKGGLVHVTGSSGAETGGMRAGDRYGMLGGSIVVEGNVGPRAGHRMRRGTIVARGQFGPTAGARMMGGTLWTEKGFAADPGLQMRRGTLIGPKVERLLPTFRDAGDHDLVILRILSRDMAARLGNLAPKPLPLKVRKISGDLAVFGKGELLLTA